MKKYPDLARLARWLRTWIQPDGAIFGFHNHSVWGDNPYRYGELTCNHSTFASPLLPALAQAWKARPDERGWELLQRLLHFQASTFQEDGQYRHIGFQVGEMLNRGLIHNVVPNVSLASAAATLKADLDSELLQKVDHAIRRNLEACDRCYGAEPSNGLDGKPGSTSNQEYCRLWARLLHMETFEHNQWDSIVRPALHFMIEYFHVSGVPDAESSGSRREATEDRYLEPAEYYGLMIAPLILGYQRYGEERFLEGARKLARHITRSSWRDSSGRYRFHRLYHKDGLHYTRIREPMLIGGMGITLHSIQQLQMIAPDSEYAEFLNQCDQTYAHYQSPAGFFQAATGWSKEPDIIPSSAWQSHDLFYLVNRHGVASDFWDTCFQPQTGLAVVFGENNVWLEDDEHWALRGYLTMHDAGLCGRKDNGRFFRDIPRWITGSECTPEHFHIHEEPVFQRLDDAIVHFSGRADLHVLNATARPFRVRRDET